jgi:hypothetical protein
MTANRNADFPWTEDSDSQPDAPDVQPTLVIESFVHPPSDGACAAGEGKAGERLRGIELVLDELATDEQAPALPGLSVTTLYQLMCQIQQISRNIPPGDDYVGRR